MMYPFAKTFASLTKANLFGLMLACAGLALAVVLVAVGGLTWIAAHLVKIETGWLDTLVSWILGVLTGIGGWFMLPALTVLIAGMFQEKVIHRVERIYYPDAVRREGPGFWPDVGHESSSPFGPCF